MEYEWDRAFRGVGVTYEKRVVRVANDKALMALFRSSGRKGALALSEYITCEHAKRFDEDLRITKKSLAAEIYGHYVLMRISLRAKKRFGNIKPVRWMIRHMDVVDCGDRGVDNNRFVWDIYSILW